jgi:hypothetical protein
MGAGRSQVRARLHDEYQAQLERRVTRWQRKRDAHNTDIAGDIERGRLQCERVWRLLALPDARRHRHQGVRYHAQLLGSSEMRIVPLRAGSAVEVLASVDTQLRGQGARLIEVRRHPETQAITELHYYLPEGRTFGFADSGGDSPH